MKTNERRENTKAHGRGRRAFWPRVLLGVSIILVIVTLIASREWKTGLTVKDIRVEGNVNVRSEEILSRASIRPGEPLFGLDLVTARDRILSDPFIKWAGVTRDVPGTIVILIEERTPIIAVGLSEILFVDADGVVLPPASSEHVVDIPIVTGSISADANTIGRVTNDEGVRAALEIVAMSLKISDELYRNISEIHVQAAGNVLLYLSEHGVPVVIGKGDIARKLMTLEAFLAAIVRGRGLHSLQYVDLRFHEMVVTRWNTSHATEPAAPM